MATITAPQNVVAGALAALAAVFAFSLNDVSIKFLSGDYALHQIVLIRSVIGMVVLMAVIVPLEGGLNVLKTRRLGAHVFRGLCVVFANMMFFLGLAVMPLADTVAIFFISPLIITALSVVLLGESVGPRRWGAVAVGLVGVVVMLRPGSGSFQVASLFPLAAAFGYAFLHIMTRRIGATESAATMAVYIQAVFIVTSGAIGLWLGQGQYSGQGGVSLEFVLRGWIWPAPGDYPVLVGIGFASAFGGYFISQAYRQCEAAIVAPLEYIAMPMAVFWGVVIFNEWPDGTAWLGMILIMGAGLFLFLREMVQERRLKPRLPPSAR